MRLFGVEIRRYFSRWAIRGGLAVIAVVAGLIITGQFIMAKPPSAAEIAQSQEYYELALAEYEEHGAEWEADCLEQQALEREMADDETIEFGCEDLKPRPEYFQTYRTVQGELETGLFMSAGLVAIALIFALASTYMASEFSTGTMSTWLTFEPRRQRVYLSKIGAGAASSMIVMGALALVLWVSARVIVRVWDIPVEGPDDGFWQLQGGAHEIALRFIAVAAFVGIIAVALSSFVRLTAGVLAIGVGFFVADMVTKGMYTPLTKFSLITHIDGVVQAGATYYDETCRTTAQGSECDYIERVIPFSTSIIVLIAVAIVATALGAWQFQRRDVG